MSDNVRITQNANATPPDGTVIATDEVSGVQYQIMKLATGAKSEYVKLEAAKDILDRAGFKPVDRSQVQVAGDIRVSIDLG